MPKIDTSSVPVRKGSGYPRPFDAQCAARTRRRLGDAGGLRDFGVNLMTLLPGGWSSQRHWHSHEDEFVYLLEGELVLVEDGGKWPPPDQQVKLDGGLSRGRFSNPAGSYNVFRYRLEESERRREIRSQGRYAVSIVVA